MRLFLALVIVMACSSVQAAGPCRNGRCAVGPGAAVRVPARVATRAVTAPVRMTRLVFGR